MGIKFRNGRLGHRVGGFYVSTPVTGRNAGRSVRVGHRLPGGLYGSVTTVATADKSLTGQRSANRRVRAFDALMVITSVGLIVAGYWLAGTLMLIIFLGGFFGSFVGSDGRFHLHS